MHSCRLARGAAVLAAAHILLHVLAPATLLVDVAAHTVALVAALACWARGRARRS